MRAARLGLLLGAMASLGGAALLGSGGVQAASDAHSKPEEEFRTSDRCVACHNGLKTSQGEDISIGFQWRASVMANAGRDPYWQGSVRRETIDHPESSLEIQNECSTCHMPMQHLADRDVGVKTDVLSRLPFSAEKDHFKAYKDGVSCSVCHQVEAKGLGTQETFNGNVAVAAPADKAHRQEYGPFDVDAGHQRVMQSSTKGFVPTEAAHIRDSGLCGSCHTLYTIARGPGGKEIGKLPEQMPFLEWQHSDYYNRESCQSCHMPEVTEPTRITAVFGPERTGMHRHVFVGGNVLLPQVLNEHRDELDVQALPEELKDATDRTTEFLKTRSARVSIADVQENAGDVQFAVRVENLTGHKLPTAYPSRRAWLHVVVRDAAGKVVFESGTLRPDGSIAGNDNDADPKRFEPHYTEITKQDQVQIFEPILKDLNGNVTTGLIAAVGYLKDNRILPSGFDKKSAAADVAVVGGAAEDANFAGGASLTRYVVPAANAQGPFRIEAELWYQPVGFRWAHNLEPYQAAEPQRWVKYYEENAAQNAVVLGRAER
ncbi:hypothetical protein [Occallatibacter riparius]|uniref:Cytochrome c-552/4 domain-containing protein n=1 Tax=Occallatibacter riparius TaxID=1002689 RepID=A0A9J7BT13_9BACT|nr:hypothetical protein [Occallatibacter riparius]UWZ84890.1 hypothetical protein MOP44_02875 [Occallatibacter riparius]